MNSISFPVRSALAAAFLVSIMLFAPAISSALTPPSKEQLIADLQAQIQALLEQLAILQGGEQACLRLSYNLYLGVSDAQTNGEVSKLQQFLRSTGDYSYSEITGYFGPSTERAVQSWQTKNGVVSSGAPETTGYGVVGPQTRAALARACGDIPTPPIPLPRLDLSASPSSGNAPLEVQFKYVLNPERSCSQQSYTLNFGDGESQVLENPNDVCHAYTQYTSHTYDNPGWYTAILSRNDKEGVAVATQVKVGNPTEAQFSASPTSGLAPLTVRFQGGGSDLSFDAYIDFGDGDKDVVGSDFDFYRSYQDPGTYTATLHKDGAKGEIVARATVLVRQVSEVEVHIIEPDEGDSYTYGEKLTVSWDQEDSVPKGSRACVALLHQTTGARMSWPSDGDSCVSIAGEEPTRSVSDIIGRRPGYDFSPGMYRAQVRLIAPPRTDGKDSATLAADLSDVFEIIESEQENPGSITISGAPINNSTLSNIPTNTNGVKLAEFTVTAGDEENVRLKSFVFTIRNVGSDTTVATDLDVRSVNIGGKEYPVEIISQGLYSRYKAVLGVGQDFARGEPTTVIIYGNVGDSSGGTLDLWFYEAEMEFVGVSSGDRIVPVSTVSNRGNHIYWSGWLRVAASAPSNPSPEPSPYSQASYYNQGSYYIRYDDPRG